MTQIEFIENEVTQAWNRHEEKMMDRSDCNEANHEIKYDVMNKDFDNEKSVCTN